MTLQRVALEPSVATEDFAARLGKHSLHDMNLSRMAQRVVMFTPTVATVERLIDRWQAEVGTFASLAAIRRVMSANPAAIQALALRDSFDWANPSAEGFMAILPLSLEGHLALLDGRFAVGDPDPTHLVGQHEEAAAVYFAAIYAPGALAGGVGLAFDQVSTPLRREADLYARAGTPRGRRLVKGLGFTPLRAARDGEVSELYVFRRSRPAPRRPIYDSYPSATGQYGVTVVRNQDDLAKVMAVRSAAYIGEQTCPYDEEFDGNDFASTHLLGYVGDEPVASIRIRCFAGFAKVERLAVRQDHRQSRIAFVIVRAAHEICRVKGYTRIYGHAQKQLVPFWEKSSGARVLDGARDLVFSDFDYVEMVAEPAPHPDAISLTSDPYVIIRPEGRWHVPGVLEKSAARPVTLHSADPQVRKRRRA